MRLALNRIAGTQVLLGQSFVWKPSLALFAVCAALSLFLSSAQAERVYVSPLGNDATAEPGNPDRPFASLTLAFRALGHGSVLEIAPGQYEIQPGYPTQWYSLPDFAPMQLKNLTNVAIVGRGDVEIFGRGPGDFLMIENCADIRISNLAFRGDRPKIPPDGPLFATVLLRAENRRLRFENCRFTGFGNHGISHLFGPKWSFDTVVTNCYFADGGDGETHSDLVEDGAAISGISPGSLIMSNFIERCYRGIEIEGAFGYPVTNVAIHGNTTTNCHTFGIMLFGTGSEPHEYEDIRITGNRILDMRNDPNATPFPRYGFGIWLGAGQSVTIAGNFVDGFDYGGGISVMSAFLPSRSIVVASNVVRNVSLRGIQVYQQYSNVLEDASIFANRVELTGDEGILLNGRNISCVSNTVIDCGWSWTRAGILVENEYLGSSSALLQDNQVRSSAEPITTYGISIGDGARGALLTGNLFTNLAGDAILDRGADTQVIPKIISIQDLEGAVAVTFTGKPSVWRNLQFTRDFRTWTTVANGLSSREGVLSLVHDVSRLEQAGAARRRPVIYRVEAPPP